MERPTQIRSEEEVVSELSADLMDLGVGNEEFPPLDRAREAIKERIRIYVSRIEDEQRGA